MFQLNYTLLDGSPADLNKKAYPTKIFQSYALHIICEIHRIVFCIQKSSSIEPKHDVLPLLDKSLCSFLEAA